MRPLAGALLVLTLLGGCTPPVTGGPDTPLALSLGLRPKGSCDISPVQYRTECLAAVELIVVPEAGEPQRSCHVLPSDARHATLADLLFADEPVVRLGTVTGRGPVVFQVRGIHEKGLLEGEDPCEAAASSQHWLFWGESVPVDLDDDDALDALHVTLPIDCRDCSRGCESLGTPQCPAVLPPSYCVPFAAGFSCERRCDTDEECFEGALFCGEDTGRCDTESGEPKTLNTGGFCTPCGGAGDCDSGFSCVGSPNASEGLCTRDCPLNRCLSGATCRRLGAGLVLLP